jgi:hypothetical protein
MLPLTDLFVHVYVYLLVDEGVGRGAGAGPRPRCSDTEVLTVALVRRPVAALRICVETTIGELPEGLDLARHRAKTLWGPFARAVATILAQPSCGLASRSR